MIVVHLAASPFVGGIETQLLGLIGHLPEGYRSAVLSFSERGLCRPLLEAASRLGAEAVELTHNAPQYHAAVNEIAGHLRRLGADVLCCHGYKPDVLGLFAARRAGVPVVSVSHGWTAATLKVRLNETIDRLCLLGMDRVVCVSEAQARRVRRAGVPARRVMAIHNAVAAGPDMENDSTARAEVLRLFPEPPRLVVGTAGRLSPEKGFGVLVEAAAIVARANPDVGFIHFGDGPLRAGLTARIAALGLERRFALAGFRIDVRLLLPGLDLFALPSYIEGLPVAVLEAFAAGLPLVATAVGGTPEVVEDGVSGRLVPAGDPAALSEAIARLLADPHARRAMGRRGRARVLERFTFEAQADAYQRLFETLRPRHAALAGLGARRHFPSITTQNPL
jgi:glycosyltransferase involved in cell wall biosynthesis